LAAFGGQNVGRKLERQFGAEGRGLKWKKEGTQRDLIFTQFSRFSELRKRK